VHRCNRASAVYNQTEARVQYSDQLYRGGQRFASGLFEDFEDWRCVCACVLLLLLTRRSA
jgi:hypothetical protein